MRDTGREMRDKDREIRGLERVILNALNIVLYYSYIGCPIFAYIFFPLRSETKRNRNRFASFSLRFAKQKQ